MIIIVDVFKIDEDGGRGILTLDAIFLQEYFNESVESQQ